MQIAMSGVLMIATTATSQSVPNELSEFTTDTGLCDVTYKKDIQIKYLDTSLTFDIPKSYTTKLTPLWQRRGVSPPTGRELKPLQPVMCLANEGDKVLITSVDPNDRSCGWVLKSDLADVNHSDPT